MSRNVLGDVWTGGRAGFFGWEGGFLCLKEKIIHKVTSRLTAIPSQLLACALSASNSATSADGRAASQACQMQTQSDQRNIQWQGCLSLCVATVHALSGNVLLTLDSGTHKTPQCMATYRLILLSLSLSLSEPSEPSAWRPGQCVPGSKPRQQQTSSTLSRRCRPHPVSTKLFSRSLSLSKNRQKHQRHCTSREHAAAQELDMDGV